MKYALAVFVALAAAPAFAAADRSLIEEDTGQNCTVNQDAPLYAAPDLKARVAAQASEGETVHVMGGKQFGEPVAFPHLDSEWARTWLRVRATESRKAGWTPASLVNCALN